MIEFILSALAAIVLAALGAMAGAQANASAPAVARWIVRRAVLRLPPELRERYTEQWLADLQDIPGPLAKLWTAVGFVVSTGALGREHAGKQLVAEVNPQSSVKRGVRGQLGYAVGYVTGSFVRAMSLYLKFVERAAVKAAETLPQRSKRIWFLIIASVVCGAWLFDKSQSAWVPYLSLMR